jgi:hypothetical protein
MISDTRWGISKKKKAIWFFKKESTSRSMCWSRSIKELDDHLKRCNMTNLEYLEGLLKFKEFKWKR